MGTKLGAAVSPTILGGGPVKAGMLIKQGINTGPALSLMILGSIEDGSFLGISVADSFKILLVRQTN